jgi:hypothetical protein
VKRIFVFIVFTALLSVSPSEEQKAAELFRRAVQTINRLSDCQVRYRDDNSFGPGQKLHAHFIYEGRYIRSPRFYYQRVLECEFNYPEQTTPGFQEIYREPEDLIFILPPAYRALGVISMFPEDPKSYGPRGENTKSSAPWDFMNELAGLAQKGRVAVVDENYQGRDCLRFSIVGESGVWNRPGMERACLWVDKKTLLPVRIEKYERDWPKPVVVTEYESFAADTGLKPEQVRFEGLKNPLSLIKTPKAEEIEPLLKRVPRRKLPEPAPGPEQILHGFYEAVAGIANYRADLTMSFRYGRLRLYRADRFAYSREPYWFTLFTTEQRANYLLLSHSAGSALWYSPEDKNLHLRGGGLQRLTGEQTFSGDDYKFYDQVGDNPYQLNFPELQKLVSGDFANAQARAWSVEYQGGKMWELELLRTSWTPPGRPGKLNLIIDPESHLPAALELSGYDDPKAFIACTFSNLKLNQDLRPGEFRF